MSKARKYYDLIDVEPKDYVSKIGAHRYGLKFQTKHPYHGKSAAVIQMNGATAGPRANKKGWKCDPTIGKVLSWCYENPKSPFETVHCLNLFSYVDPKPGNLEKLKSNDLNNPENDEWIKEVCKNVDTIILAYGDCKGIELSIVKERVDKVLKYLEKYDLHRVGDLTIKGTNPRHGRAWNNNPSLILHRKKAKA